MSNYSASITDFLELFPELDSLINSISDSLQKIGISGVSISINGTSSSIWGDPPPLLNHDDYLATLDPPDYLQAYEELDNPLIDPTVILSEPAPEDISINEGIYTPSQYTLTLLLKVLSEVVIQFAGFDAISLVLNPSGFEASITFTDDQFINLGVGIGVGIRFSSDYLQPMKKITESGGNVQYEPDESRDYVQVEIASATITVDAEGDFDVEGGLGFQIDGPVMIGETGIILENLDIELNLSGTGARPAGTPDDWKGFMINSAKLAIPDLFSGSIDITGLGIGSGGVSGHIGANLHIDVDEERKNFRDSTELKVSLFGGKFEAALGGVGITFLENVPTEFSVGGALKLPVFERIVRFNIGIGDDGEYIGQVSGYAAGEKILLFGSPPEETHLMLESVSVSRQPPDTYELALRDVDLAIKPGDDGLLQEILPADGITATVGDDGDLILGYSSSRGVYFEGGSIEIAIPLHKTFGPVTLDVLYIGFSSSGSTTLLELAATLGAKIGPVSGSIDRMGIALPITPNDNGNFGPVDIGSPRFKFPDGIALGFSGNGITGGGSIFRNETQYAGSFELKLTTFGITALAVIDTEPVFSFIVAIFAELNIQLGAGFKLSKVGGLLGIHRTVSHQTIAPGIQAGILDDLLFPTNVVENAPRVVQNYAAAFPVRRDQYLFGPAVQVGYGTPTLISASLAILLEFPDPFAITILGKITSKIPEAEPIVQLNLGIVGVIDFPNRYMAMYGSLYDSRLLRFTLSGNMAMTLSWGSEKNFIFSIGGFHPRYKKPENFPPFGAPPLRRLQIAFSNYVTLETYLAITTNTFQVGARVDARFSGAGAKIHGYLGFDALIQFSPLYYKVEVASGFSVKFKGRSLANIEFAGSLKGPNPHKIKGKASFSILWWDVKVKVKKTFGQEKREVVEKNDPWELLEPAVNRPESWEPIVPQWAQKGVVFRDASKVLGLVHPLGQLKFSQNAVPINYTIDWVVTGAPKNFSRFELNTNGPNLITSTAQDYFAPAHWTKLSQSEKLTAKSTDLMDSGIIIETDAVDFDLDSPSQREMSYETVVHSKFEERRKVTVASFKPNLLQITLLQMSATAYRVNSLNHISTQYNYGHIEPATAVSNENFVTVDGNLEKVTEAELVGSFSQAVTRNKLQDYQRSHLEDMREFQVISEFELEGAIL